ncbi:MAG TPA: DUF192 domain-containing protein [Spirochaetota bacterium]|nr:MAG: hypothetical protein BWX91_01886 [Spirochaetes bacterium ADurb.Bin133]HNZ26293.1 DUF192 domain-containing protein [Spirochaetota bacterium]HOE99771.1 DUF192 domain-containing protein [Spirochaetota bacterium]HOS32774.1 DUF192 domain-containing protein [Spirochaetota bacterium]HOS56416.1 DUF192 domain-containing protein [Spirochaetota bacterium]
MSKYSIKIFLCILLALLLTNCGSEKRYVKAKINNKIYKFELALTEEEKGTGLMFRKKLDPDGGMLFVYSYMTIMDFYMKNTLIPLDIAFIDGGFKIVDIQSMNPLDETTVRSKKRCMYALEVNRGFFERIGVKEGDTIEFITPIPYVTEL